MPLFTIHDSIVTTVEFKDVVKNKLSDVLEAGIGYKPTIKEESF